MRHEPKVFETAEPAQVTRFTHAVGYLALISIGTAVVMLSTLIAERVAGNVLLILTGSGLILIATTVVWTRREGLTSPIPIVTMGLLLYFPVRALVLLSSGLTNDQGINQRVLDAINRGETLFATLDVLALSVAFSVGCEFFWRQRRRRISVPLDPDLQPGSAEANNLLLRPWSTALMLVGVVGILLQVPAGLGWLHGDEASGGLTWYLVYLAGFGFSLGIVLSGRANGRLPALAWLLLGAVGALAFYMGSKDTLFQPLIALLYAGATVSRPANSMRRLAAVGITVAALIFIVFPAVTTYRNEIFAGQGFTQALTGVPSELINKTVVGSSPRTGGLAGYVDDSLLYLTNRLSGFDSLLLASDAPHDTQLLTVQSMAFSPLGLLMPSGFWSSSVAQPGHYFGQQYWGSVPSNNVSIAITIFGEVQLAFGALAVPVAAVLLALVATLAARFYRAPKRAARALGLIFMVTAIGFEHDVLYLLITTERRLALLGIVLGLATLGRRELQPARWKVAPPAQPPLTKAGAGR